MAEEDEVSKIMAVAEKYSDYFNEWHSDIAIGRKGPNFFYVYNDQYRYSGCLRNSARRRNWRS